MSVGEPPSAAFAMTVDGVQVPLYIARVSKAPINRRWPGHQRPVEQTELVSFALFEMDSPAEVVLKPSRSFQQVVVRPLSKQVQLVVDEGTIRFQLPSAGAYTVELDGYHGALHIFADRVKTYDVDPEDEDVLYFGKGIHDMGVIRLTSNQTLFIDEGAVVYARIEAYDAHNIRILGRGILDGSRNTEKILFEFGEKEIEQFNKGFAVTNAERRHTVQIEFCDNVCIDGITIRDSLVYNIRP
jgi:polygalacturonase